MDYDHKKYPMIWKRTLRTGYCFTAKIPCRMIRWIGKKIEIAALLMNGRERIHQVKPDDLFHEHCSCFGKCREIERIEQPKYVFLMSERGRCSMAQVLRFHWQSPSSITTVTLKSQDGHGEFYLPMSEVEWSLETGRRVRVLSDEWKIVATDLEALRQQARDLERVKVTAK